jgi:hypothetical protein
MDWKYAKPPPPLNPVRFEICVIHGENSEQRFSLGEVNKRGVGEIHWAVPVAIHQIVQMLQFHFLDRS